MFSCQSTHPELGINAGAAKRLFLHPNQLLEVMAQLLRGHVYLVRGRVSGVDDHIHPALFRERLVRRHEAERVQHQLRTTQASHRHDDRRGVDSTGERGPHRHVAAQVQPHAVQKQVADATRRFVERQLGTWPAARLPVASELRRSGVVDVDDGASAGRHLLDLREQRSVAVIRDPVAEIGEQPRVLADSAPVARPVGSAVLVPGRRFLDAGAHK